MGVSVRWRKADQTRTEWKMAGGREREELLGVVERIRECCKNALRQTVETGGIIENTGSGWCRVRVWDCVKDAWRKAERGRRWRVLEMEERRTAVR